VIHVVAEITVAPGGRARFLEEFAKLVPAVRAEDGCLEYGAAVDLSSGLAAASPVRSDVVTVVERWRDVAALGAHLEAAHMERYRATVKELVRDVAIHVLAPVEGRA
jgi:quinol monooxygenase YgiN